ncbi:sensor histidine kinase [Streptomyces noursei]|uniref:sensor histidine kinase n=1 Tax=Streptomyces TaxID=1883 RepID=UPI0035DB453F
MKAERKNFAERIVWTARSALRTLSEDLFSLAPQPLPPLSRPRWLRRLPHVALCIAAVVLTGLGWELAHTYPSGVSTEFIWLLAAGHAAALVVALSRPMAGWWISVTAAVVTAQTVFPPENSHGLWPWTYPGVVIHSLVLFLVVLRSRPRVSAEVLLLSVLVTVAQTAGTSDYAQYMPGAGQAVLLFTMVVMVAAALRGRRVARAQLAEQETLTAEERARRTLLEERSRIARELHDVVAHHMSVISIQADAAPHRVPDPPQELTASFAVIRENALEALTELRRILGVLRSEDPEAKAPQAPQPTLARLEDLLNNVRTAGLTVASKVTGPARQLPPGVALTGYRIVQEALSNAIRYAPGSDVRVEVHYTPQGAYVRVVNSPPDGEPRPSAGAGHGLLGMHERTTMLGGDLAAGPTPEGGYEVAAFLPAPAAIGAAAGMSESTPT